MVQGGSKFRNLVPNSKPGVETGKRKFPAGWCPIAQMGAEGRLQRFRSGAASENDAPLFGIRRLTRRRCRSSRRAHELGGAGSGSGRASGVSSQQLALGHADDCVIEHHRHIARCDDRAIDALRRADRRGCDGLCPVAAGTARRRPSLCRDQGSQLGSRELRTESATDPPAAAGIRRARLRRRIFAHELSRPVARSALPTSCRSLSSVSGTRRKPAIGSRHAPCTRSSIRSRSRSTAMRPADGRRCGSRPAGPAVARPRHCGGDLGKRGSKIEG